MPDRTDARSTPFRIGIRWPGGMHIRAIGAAGSVRALSPKRSR